ncbi:unnamed protein product [Lymnaea stagnalis]|uniref:AIG1-type G domain-containing protein n=1 Tax=Lymnaea stagnalis TaxID=6523 RepID=A0AAV2GZI0_LYMST
MSSASDLNMVLLGKTGNGKSSTGNTILRRDVFPTSDRSTSLTKLATLECSQSELTSSIIHVVDTPGLMDTDDDDALSVIGQGMSLCPDGFDAVIVVLRYGSTLTREEEGCVNILKQHLGPTFLQDYGVIIMTHGDSFDLNRTAISFSDWCRAENHNDKFGHLLTECRGRCVLFHNKGNQYEEKRERSVVALIDIIRTRIRRRYRCQNFDAAVETRNIMLEKINMPALHKVVQENISLMEELLQKDMKSETFSFDNMNNRAQELHKAINDLPDSPEVKVLIVKIKLITDKIDYLKRETDKQKRSETQKQMKKDLRIVKNPPSKSPVIIANVQLMFAKVAYPLGITFTLGFAADFLRNLVFEKKIVYEVEVKMFEKRNKRYAEAMERYLKLDSLSSS